MITIPLPPFHPENVNAQPHPHPQVLVPPLDQFHVELQAPQPPAPHVQGVPQEL